MTEEEFLNTKWSKSSVVVYKVVNLQNTWGNPLNSDIFSDIIMGKKPFATDRYFHTFGVNWKTQELKIHYPDCPLKEKLDGNGFMWVSYKQLRKYS